MSTQAQGMRGPPLRGYRRRKTMLDLNVPPSESRDQEGTSAQNVLQEVQASQQVRPIPANTIDVEAIDDDVIESSPRAFAEAKSNAQRNNAQRNHTQRTCGNAVVVDVDSGRTTRLTYNNPNKRRRSPSNHAVINCEHYVNLESSGSSMRDNAQQLQPPPPPKEPTFNCPICMGPFVEETSTKCGHIFCKACIRAAIGVQSKCPTCRKKVTVKELIRVFLPATS
ncbi:E3 ubiquitin-protein ligase RNF4 isoform X2 [Jatropha curcas]|uniref:E3 ubiquitin-protein ligase RNF4 isoform X2 n=1 Tax=Jatropha curcas TaxID=180498 RepID=UPI0005FBAE2D|nr:E3 ubiquitin-protein ligase RNF4 isoform X2 [Jatropha curcas]XP_012085072.1 E3 ubiquitin-protein ligase RNF4 isoform X2 [Jatropha curcas]